MQLVLTPAWRRWMFGLGMLPTLALFGCALTPPAATVLSQAPTQWQAPQPASPPLAHDGSVQRLTAWWQQFNDPLLTELITAGQNASASVAAAQTRIAQARAFQTSADAALQPNLTAGASASRARSQPNFPLATTAQARLQTAWEIDLFGGGRRSSDAARQRLAGAQALWHDARVSVAAEVALQYFSLSVCSQQTQLTERDAASRAETARLADLTASAGFTAPATAALARASALEASARLRQQRAECAVQTKALVALTGLLEGDLQTRMAAAAAKNEPNPALTQVFKSSYAIFSIANLIASLPAQTLAQRPDVFNAEREVAAASQDVGAAQAQRYPRLGLSGAIGRLNSRAGGMTSSLSTWSIGPLELSVPLLDGGVARANIATADAAYNQAVVQYRSVVRQAVREVEEALVNLDSTQARQADSAGAADGFRRSFVATEARYRNGLASLVELEDARRTLLSAETSLITLQKERNAAWVALYRAAGGGWSADAPAPDVPRNPS